MESSASQRLLRILKNKDMDWKLAMPPRAVI